MHRIIRKSGKTMAISFTSSPSTSSTSISGQSGIIDPSLMLNSWEKVPTKIKNRHDKSHVCFSDSTVTARPTKESIKERENSLSQKGLQDYPKNYNDVLKPETRHSSCRRSNSRNKKSETYYSRKIHRSRPKSTEFIREKDVKIPPLRLGDHLSESSREYRNLSSRSTESKASFFKRFFSQIPKISPRNRLSELKNSKSEIY
jgi:hypothetical protein